MQANVNYRRTICKCINCGKEESRPNSQVFKYCSKSCEVEYRVKSKTKVVYCPCGKELRVPLNRLARNINNYCSVDHYHLYSPGRPRSRNEELFFEKIKKHFPNAKANARLKRREADILIEELKIAVHWDGGWHHIPMRGQKLLQRIKRRDKERNALFESLGYTNYIINDLGGFNPKKVDNELCKFLEIYRNR
jgi:hypothetical protein